MPERTCDHFLRFLERDQGRIHQEVIITEQGRYYGLSYVDFLPWVFSFHPYLPRIFLAHHALFLTDLDPEKERTAENIIEQEVDAVAGNLAHVKENGCAACHVLFTLVGRMNLSETAAADLLTEVLLANPDLNERFIEMVENIHMKQRMMGVTFAIKTREAKDKHIDSQFKNALDELLADTANYGVDILLRKLVLPYIALEIAQNLGIDYHAATEELYYYMRKRDEETHAALLKFIQSVVDRSKYR